MSYLKHIPDAISAFDKMKAEKLIQEFGLRVNDTGDVVAGSTVSCSIIHVSLMIEELKMLRSMVEKDGIDDFMADQLDFMIQGFKRVKQVLYEMK